MVADGGLPPPIREWSREERPACNDLGSGGEALRFPNEPCSHGKPLPEPATAGQGRKPRSGGAERASLDGMAPVRPNRGKRTFITFIRPNPRDRAKDQSTPPPGMAMPEMWLADMLFERGPPWDQAEAEAVVDHRRTGRWTS